MTHAELVNWIIGVHGVIFLGALTAYFKSVDKKLHKTSFDAGKETKQYIKEKIFVELCVALEPIFSKPNDEVLKTIQIFGPDGDVMLQSELDIS